jgi:hypothetical protein
MLISRGGQVIAAVLVILLGITGYASLSNTISLNEINQVLAGLEAQNAATATPLSLPEGAGGGVVEGAGAGAALAPGGQEQPEIVLFPTTSDTLLLSAEALAFLVRLHNPLSDTADSLEVQLFIVQGKDGTALSPGLASQPARLEALGPGETPQPDGAVCRRPLPAAGATRAGCWSIPAAPRLRVRSMSSFHAPARPSSTA